MMFEIPWEKDGRGNKAIYKDIKNFRVGLGISRSFALSKMTEISAISAVFADKRQSFYPLAWILFESSHEIEFFGLYAREEFFGLYSEEWSPNLTQDQLPTAFLKKATWTKSVERQAYKAAKTPEEYIREHLLGENHVVVNNTFLNYENATPVLALAARISERIEQGIKVDKADRCELYKSDRQDIRFHFANGYMNYNIDYGRFTYKSEELENWGRKWREQFDRVKVDLELNPTENFKVYYQSSILNYFNKFMPYFPNVIYDEVT